MTKVSIVIPVYNVEKYLLECLSSCSKQTLSDIEILCIDDKSTDSSAEILMEYAQKDERVKVFHHDINRGLAYARNTGIINAKGEYLIFLDSDDVLPPNAVENLYLRAKNTKADLVFGDFYTFYETLDKNYPDNITRNPFFYEMFSKFNEIFTIEDIYNHPDKNFLYKFLYDNIYTMCVWSKLYKTAIFKDNNILAPKLRCAEDFCMLKEYMHNSKTFTVLDNIVMLYRKHKGGFTSRKVPYVFAIFESYSHTLDMLKRTGYLESQYTNIHKFYLDMYLAHYKFCPYSLIIKYWWTFHKEVCNWDFDKIHLEELDIKQKETLTLYKSPMLIFFIKTACKLLQTKEVLKTKREILKIFPYFLVAKHIKNLNLKIN